MSLITDRIMTLRHRPDVRVIAMSSGALLAGSAALALAPGVADSAPAACKTGTVTFRAAGCYVVPAGVTGLQVIAIGAPGNEGHPEGSRTGGRGGRAVRSFKVVPGQTLYARVGLNGSNVSPHNGGASDLSKCAIGPGCKPTGRSATDPRLVVGAGGGMGGNRAKAGGIGGRGGDAGAAGETGQDYPEPDRAANTGRGGRGGGAGTRTAPGQGGAGGAGVERGLAGSAGTLAGGGAGGDYGFAYGGDGGVGFWGGGGGGAAGYTKTGFGKGTRHERGGGGGGGGGFSYAPGGQVGIDTTGVPLVAIKPMPTR